jgi:hypothetical protein
MELDNRILSFELHWLTAERRAAQRFPLKRPLVFRLRSRQSAGPDHQGESVDMSSTGLLFTTSHPLRPGERLRIAMSWPAQLEMRWPMKMVLVGEVVRCHNGMAAVKIGQYEFKTTGPNGLSL